MALEYADRVAETTTTEGTGTYSLAGAKAGFQGFVAGVGTGNTCYYCATDGTDWEVGLGTVTDAAPDTLSRDSIEASSNGGNAVDWGGGTKDVFLTVPASQVGGGTSDHGALTGLSDDDHSIYALLAGRSGGQILIGGTAAGENLTLRSTSHATRGSIILNTNSKFDEANSRLTLSHTTFTPVQAAPLQIKTDAGGTALLMQNSATEYTVFVSGGVQKGLLGTGTVEMTLANVGVVTLKGGNREGVRSSAIGGVAAISFFGATPILKPTVSGSRADTEAALADLLTELANLGLITNSTSA